MDPVSITASIVGISAVAVKVTKSLSDVLSRYRHAKLTITAICSETAVVNASLSQIQSLMFRDGDAIVAKRLIRPDLCDTFDIALTGCQLVFSCLDSEIMDLRVALNSTRRFRPQDRIKTAWKEETMAHLLGQLRGQTAALNLLLQCLQTDSMERIHRLIIRHGVQIRQISDATLSLRRLYPRTNAPESILETCRSDQSTIRGQDSESEQSDVDFAFDDAIVNSNVYRRVMNLNKAHGSSGLSGRNPAKQDNTARASIVVDHERPGVSTEMMVDSASLFASPLFQVQDLSKRNLLSVEWADIDSRPGLEHLSEGLGDDAMELLLMVRFSLRLYAVATYTLDCIFVQVYEQVTTAEQELIADSSHHILVLHNDLNNHFYRPLLQWLEKRPLEPVILADFTVRYLETAEDWYKEYVELLNKNAAALFRGREQEANSILHEFLSTEHHLMRGNQVGTPVGHWLLIPFTLLAMLMSALEDVAGADFPAVQAAIDKLEAAIDHCWNNLHDAYTRQFEDAPGTESNGA